MDEELQFGREIIMNDVLQQRDVQSSSSQVCHEQEVDKLAAELNQLVFSSSLVHRTVNETTLEPRADAHLVEIFAVVSRSTENNRLFASLHSFSQKVEERRLFFLRFYHEKVQFEVVTQL